MPICSTRRARRGSFPGSGDRAHGTGSPIEVPGVGGTGLEPVTPSLSSWCSPN